MSDHSAILFEFLTNLNKCIIPPIKVKLYLKAEWEPINSSLSNQLTILKKLSNPVLVYRSIFNYS